MSSPGDEPRLVPTELAALASGVSAATIRKRASRGLITRYGSPQRALYDLNELLRIQEDESPGPDPELSTPRGRSAGSLPAAPPSAP